MNPMDGKGAARRLFMKWGGRTLAGAWLLARPGELPAAQGAEKKKEDGKEEPEALKVLPAEDLMREHGLLSRILIIYDDAAARLGEGGDFSPEALGQSAAIVRQFIEEYHEKLEEDFLFPRFRKAGKLTGLVEVLLRQHQVGRLITGQIENGAKGGLKDAAAKRAMAGRLRQFTRMYRPHKAREDTVLFPAIRGVVGAKDYDELGEKFEGIEEQRFGEGGYEKMVEKVAAIESGLGLGDLARFTPQV